MDITVRRMRFEFPDDLDTVFIEGEPEDSYMNIALSLLLPYLEPYLIRTMRSARGHVTDPALVADLDRFVEQEGQHYRQHARFNAVFRDRGFAGLAPLERELDADYRRFSETKSLRFNLAYAEGFEAFTCAMACTACSLVERDRAKWNPAALDLFLWHLVEEIEHRTVAFDVYEHVFGSYPYRVGVGMFAQRHLLRFMWRAASTMLRADPRTPAAFGGEAGRQARARRQREDLVRELLPRVLSTYSPWYDPRKIRVPKAVEDLTAHYTTVAVSTSG
jgi:predicted metal-dependent hydrolase